MSDQAMLDHADSLDIAIVGMAGRFPGAHTVEAFWRNLCDGVESIARFHQDDLRAAGVPEAVLNLPNFVPAGTTLDDIELFDANFFGYSPREAEMIDPQQRFFLENAWEALEHAGYDPARYPGLIGVFGGVSLNTYLFSNVFGQYHSGVASDYFSVMMGSDKDFLTTRVSYKLGLKGPSFTVQTACSTSLVAVHLACQSLLSYQSDMALAGGVSISVPQQQGYLYQEGGVLSSDGYCRAFDASASGTLKGNGVGMVVLKRLADAIADGDTIHALIKGSAINNDGALKIGYTAPSQDGQAEVLDAAYAAADVAPETIGYIEAHGTATPLGDPIEVAALTHVFRKSTASKQFCALGSVKTNVGHLDAAAGITGLIKASLAVKHGLIPPSLHFTQPNPNIDFANSPFYVNNSLQDWPDGDAPRRAGVSSFGIGGTNAHVVLEEAPAVAAAEAAMPWHLLLLSAKSSTALEAATTRLADHLAQHPELDCADVAYTTQVGRQAFRHRRIAICEDSASGERTLRSLDPKSVFSGRSAAMALPVVFMFPGGGAQYPQMGAELYATEPVFRAEIDRCAELLRPHGIRDLHGLLYASADDTTAKNFERPSIALPALFATEYALARQWMAWGIQPNAMIGHSLGEYVAACLAGVLRLEDALALVTLRGRLFEQLPVGGMLSVPLSEAELRMLLTPQLSVAAINGPQQCVVAGPTDDILALEARLLERDIKCRRLPIAVAAHSRMVEPILRQFEAFIRTVPLQPPTLRYLSNVTGDWADPAEVTRPGYWVRHLRETVRFSQGIDRLLELRPAIFIEVGPGQTLSTLTRLQPAYTADQVVLPSLRHPHNQQSDRSFILTTLGRLWLSGVEIDWAALHEGQRRRRVPLPTYPFERRRYWIERQDHAAQPATDDAIASFAADEDYARPEMQTPYVAPRTATEQALAEIWTAVLGTEPIGVHDNFFELRGDSLLALQLVARLHERFQAEIPMRSIFETPTIAELAETIDALRGSATERETASPSSLVRLQPQGTKPPFFCIHPAGGIGACYAGLARLLDSDQPFYAIEALGVDGKHLPRTSIEEMARAYIQDLRTVQMEGPYLLGGWSMGGTIAFEMARQLQADGQEVDLLVLIDTPATPTGTPPSAIDDVELVSTMLGAELQLDQHQLLGHSPDTQLAILLEKAQAARILPPHFGLEQFRRVIHTFRTHSEAWWNYRPGRYDGAITVFKAEHSLADTADQPAGATIHAGLGWQAVTAGNVELYVVPGNHQTLILPPNLEALAHQLSACLQTVHESTGVVHA